MGRERYQYVILKPIPFDSIEATLHLAISAVEGMLGEARVRLDVRYTANRKSGVIEIDADNAASQRTNEVFIQFLHREIGPDAFSVYRVIARVPAPQLN